MENEEVKPKEKVIETPKWVTFVTSMNGIMATIVISGKEFNEEQKKEIGHECVKVAIPLLQKIIKF